MIKKQNNIKLTICGKKQLLPLYRIIPKTLSKKKKRILKVKKENEAKVICIKLIKVSFSICR